MTKPNYTEKDFETPYHECKNYYYDLEPQYDDKWILIFDSMLFYDDLKKIEKERLRDYHLSNVMVKELLSSIPMCEKVMSLRISIILIREALTSSQFLNIRETLENWIWIYSSSSALRISLVFLTSSESDSEVVI